MGITWHGGSCYKVQGADTTIVIDPETSPAGSRLKGDVVLHTSSPLPIELGAAHEDVIGPGEYGFGGARIKGVWCAAPSGENELWTAYKITLDELTVAVVRDAGNELAGEAIDALGGADILLAPGERASSYAKALTSKIVVVSAEGSKSAGRDLGQHPEAQEKFSVKARDLREGESLRLVVLAA